VWSTRDQVLYGTPAGSVWFYVLLQGISVGPFVKETGSKKNVRRRAKRGPLQVKVAPEQNCMGFDVQNSVSFKKQGEHTHRMKRGVVLHQKSVQA
jgi:hypothetical protein